MSLHEIAGAEYQVGRLPARTQLHVARRVMPILGSLVPLMQEQPRDGGGLPSLGLDTALPAMAEQLAAMPDADVDYIVDACLAVCSRKNEKHAGSVMTPVLARNGQLMFDDIGMGEMLQLVAAVIQENLGSFFGDLTRNSPTEGTSQPA